MGGIPAPGAGSTMDTKDMYNPNLEMHNNSEAVVVTLMLLLDVSSLCPREWYGCLYQTASIKEKKVCLYCAVEGQYRDTYLVAFKLLQN